MKITFISDTHNNHENIEIKPCDVLVHCGDGSTHGEHEELYNLFGWLAQQPAKDVIYVPGNHDIAFEKDWLNTKGYCEKVFELASTANLHIVTKGFVKICGKSFFCYSYMHKYGNWAFMRDEQWLKDDIARLPVEDVDVLVTHAPPHGILDTNLNELHCGTKPINKLVSMMSPKIHAFGHIHESYGVKETSYINFVNAAMTSHGGGVSRQPITYYLF